MNQSCIPTISDFFIKAENIYRISLMADPFDLA